MLSMPSMPMDAPSVLCLKALRSLLFPKTTRPVQRIHHRHFASGPSPPRQTIPKSKPPQRPPPAVAASNPPSAPPAIPARPSVPGYVLRRRGDDDEEFVPQPLSRPIGLPTAPNTLENRGLDLRTLRQRRDDFVDYEKHLERRKTMTRQMSKPYFRDWSNLRFSKGKIFVANERLFRAETALFFPNFFGRVLDASTPRLDKKDGYQGRGRSTCEAMDGKISLVTVFGNQWAIDQVNTFVGASQNPGLLDLIRQNKDIVQRVEINLEDNAFKYWIMKLFGLRRLRQARTAEEQQRYFIVRRGISGETKEAIGLLNDVIGYVYLVDAEHRIRWAGSALAEEGEKSSMVRGLWRLITERRKQLGQPTTDEPGVEVMSAESKQGQASAL